MRVKSIIAVLLLMVVGLQTAQAQGFRVYKSDGLVEQFSLRTDSIVFYEEFGSDADVNFDPFTPVNRCIVGTWWKSKYETVTFNEDGTTDYMEGATYKFFPYQGNIIIYNASDAPVNYFKVLELRRERMIVSSPDGSNISVWSRTVPVYLVKSIELSETSITLLTDETKRLTATVLPEDADNKEVTWESSNESVAQVINNGLVLAMSDGKCVITCRASDGSEVYAECQVIVMDHEYVDLGLPSGTLWATCNIGASSPEEYGNYYAWGEIHGDYYAWDGTSPKNEYNWSTYKYCKGSSDTMTKYCIHNDYGYNGFTDGLTELLPEDDAATANWGSGWRMPSRDQCQELINSNYTTTKWTTLNGKYGRKITSKSNGKSVFLPAAGYRTDASFNLIGSHGYYCTRSLNTKNSSIAYHLDFYSNDVNTDYSLSRCYGQSVRPVRKQ